MAVRVCNRCGNCHVGVLIFAPLGFRVVFRNEWEQSITEEDFDKWMREFVNIAKFPSASRRSFMEFVNSSASL